MAESPLLVGTPTRSPYSTRSNSSSPPSVAASPTVNRRSRYAEIHPQSSVNVVENVKNGPVTDTIRETILHMHHDQKAENTKKAYSGKEKEWTAFCDHVYGSIDRPQRYVVNSESSYTFIIYQSFRSQRRRGGKRSGTDGDSNGFSPQDYERVMSSFSGMSNVATDFRRVPEPENPLQRQAISQYKAVLRQLWMGQVARKETNTSWDLIWGQHHQVLVDMVKKRKARIAKANYSEKLDSVASPYAAIQMLPDIEKTLWNKGLGPNSKSQLAWLRHRFCFLYTFKGVLRHESLQKAELSDLMCVSFKQNRDPHPVFISVLQLATGKTNHGQKLYCVPVKSESATYKELSSRFSPDRKSVV